MRPTTLTASTLLFSAGIAKAAYKLQDNYNASNFFTSFDFFSSPDPTNGFVTYVPPLTANSSLLAGFTPENNVYLGVDYKSSPPSGRPSVRLHSKKTYTHGLFIADIVHIPASICGVWPAFWTVGQNWPNDGEIDIIEGVNMQKTNAVTLHTSPGCKVTGQGAKSSSKLQHQDCNQDTAFTGCGYTTENESGFGNGFNSIGGGVYAMEWTSSVIRVFFFPRSSIPADILDNAPNPDSKDWGEPIASFSGPGCDIDQRFKEHQIVFNTAFCGQWAGQKDVWEQGGCREKTGKATCDEWVAGDGARFSMAYWEIRGVRVYGE